MTITERIYNSQIGAFCFYGKTADSGSGDVLRAISVGNDGAMSVSYARPGSSSGKSGVAQKPDTSSRAAMTDNPATSEKLCVDDVLLYSAVANTFTFYVQSGTSTYDTVFTVGVSAGVSMHYIPHALLKLNYADKPLLCNISSSDNNASVLVGWHSEA